MARTEAVLACAAAMAAIWTVIGLPVAFRYAPRPLAWFIAPAMGWSVFNTPALLVYAAIGMTRPAVLAVTGLAIVIAIAALWASRPFKTLGRSVAVPLIAIMAAAVLALIPMAGILSKDIVDGVVLAPPMFDHSKIALVDEMIRSGVPAANPVYSEVGAPERVSYYYLWHFSAAAMAVLIGVSGWEADAALTAFTAFASLSLMIGFAGWISGRASAGILVVAIAATASARSIATWLFGSEAVHALVGWSTGFGGWLFQVSWAPQHVASATCVVLACYLLTQLASAPGPALVVIAALVIAAGFESSLWVGGVVFALAAVTIGLRLLWVAQPKQRRQLLMSAAAAAALSIALVSPLLYDQFVAAALRGGGAPIAFAPVQVLGSAFPEGFRRVLDLPAYWLVYLPLEFPAFYPVGLAALWLSIRHRTMPDDHRQAVLALGLLTAASLSAAWLLASVVGSNNDLGWRAVLPAVLSLIVFAAVGLSQWLTTRKRLLSALGAFGLLLGLPEGVLIARDNIIAQPNGSARLFAATPAMWEAVRQHSAADDRIANNPSFLGDATAWPVNISWALLADRRSCYAGSELALASAPISAARRAERDLQFTRVFDGRPEPEDLTEMARRYRCDVVVVTAQDGAWQRDPFESSALYRLAESRPGAWRIYRRAAPRR